MITTLKGSYRTEKSFIEFTLALRKQFEQAGGNLRTNCEVDKILTEHGKIMGIRTTKSKIIYSDYVVSTADTMVTFKNLTDNSIVHKLNPKYSGKLNSVKMSPSGFSIHLGLDGVLYLDKHDFNCG